MKKNKKKRSFFERKIMLPFTRLVSLIIKFFSNFWTKSEMLLSKNNTLLFVSLFLAVVLFVFVDQKIITLSENSAEVLKEQPVYATYNEESYVVTGLPETVDVTLIGSKADLYFAKQSPSKKISVDLSNLKPGTHKVNIKYDQALPSIDYKVNPSVATVIIYPKISETRTLSIDILNKKNLDSKLLMKNISVENENVVIKGAEHQLKEVASVKALLDVDTLPKQEEGKYIVKDVPLKAYSKDGDPLDIEIVPEKIDVNVELASPSKEVPIRVVPTGEVSFGMAISEMKTSETKVTVYGEEEALSNLNYLPLQVDVSNLKENKEYKLELTKPVGITAMSVNNVTVKFSLGPAANRTIDNVKIEYRNLASNYTVKGLSQDDIKLSVSLNGVKSVIDSITSEDISAYLDLEGYKEGEHEVPVNVSGSDARVNYTAKTKKVKIKIEKNH